MKVFFIFFQGFRGSHPSAHPHQRGVRPGSGRWPRIDRAGVGETTTLYSPMKETGDATAGLAEVTAGGHDREGMECH